MWFWGPPKWGILGSQASNGEILGSSSQKWGGFGEVFYPPPTLPPPSCGVLGFQFKFGGEVLGSLICRPGGFWGPNFPLGYEIWGGGGLLPQIMRGFLGSPTPGMGSLGGAPLSPQIKIWGAPPLDRGGLGVPDPKL